MIVRWLLLLLVALGLTIQWNAPSVYADNDDNEIEREDDDDDDDDDEGEDEDDDDDRDEDEEEERDIKITQGDVDNAMNMVKTRYPMLFSGVEWVRSQDVEHYTDLTRDITRRLIEVDQEGEEEIVVDLSAYELTVELLSEKYRRSEMPEDKQRVETDMRKALNILFDLKIKMREREFEELEEELNRLKGPLDQAKATKQQQIDRYLKRLTQPTIFED